MVALTPVHFLGVAAAPTLAHSVVLPGAGAGAIPHPDLALRFAVAVMHPTADPVLPPDGPGPGLGPGLFLALRPNAELVPVPAPTTHEVRVVAAAHIVARSLGGQNGTPNPRRRLLGADVMIRTLARLLLSVGTNHGVEAIREHRLAVDRPILVW